VFDVSVVGPELMVFADTKSSEAKSNRIHVLSQSSGFRQLAQSWLTVYTSNRGFLEHEVFEREAVGAAPTSDHVSRRRGSFGSLCIWELVVADHVVGQVVGSVYWLHQI
jgi:hypothetical protein